MYYIDDQRFMMGNLVEPAGVEPASKQRSKKPSTCLFPYWLSAMFRKGTNPNMT